MVGTINSVVVEATEITIYQNQLKDLNDAIATWADEHRLPYLQKEKALARIGKQREQQKTRLASMQQDTVAALKQESANRLLTRDNCEKELIDLQSAALRLLPKNSKRFDPSIST